MKRSAWIMTLKPGCEAEYKARHDAIWPEMLALMRSRGILNFSIYRHGLTLFAVQDREDDAEDAPPDTIQWRWWAEMQPLMECHPDTRPIRIPVEEVFSYRSEPTPEAGR